ncbi:hypothetical protein SASPL_143810 [Salvia splendens]|uniref:Auxin-responsive protein n=1 Tax=Salvia splendens TaxID=180675 RepID=A0A8X8WNC7_SALSN|nr:hypothetical protein SASPL_143810 [Salvia splendens]
MKLDLALSNTSIHNLPQNDEKKRKLDESFFDDEMTSNKRTLRLDCGCVDVEEDAVVGWPPMNSRMRKVAELHRRESTASTWITAAAALEEED